MTSPHPVHPADSGGAVRTVSIAGALVELGHRVTIASPGEPPTGVGVEHVAFRAGGRVGHFVNRSLSARMTEILATGPDLVVAEFPYQVWAIAGACRRAGVPIVYDAHNVEADRFRRMRRPLVSHVVRMAESRICAIARAVLTVSEDDQRLLRELHDCDSLLLPNGVDTNRFTPVPPSGKLIQRYDLVDRRVVLYFGSYDYAPNAEALRFLVEAWPSVLRDRSDARLLVVGRRPPEWSRNREGVVVTGPVEDVAAHVRLAHVVAVPLATGGGTRLKILEALACGTTILTTPFGASGIPAEGTEALEYVELSSFTERLVDLLAEVPPRGGRRAARELAERYDWLELVAAVPWNDFATDSSPARTTTSTPPRSGASAPAEAAR